MDLIVDISREIPASASLSSATLEMSDAAELKVRPTTFGRYFRPHRFWQASTDGRLGSGLEGCCSSSEYTASIQ